MLEATPAAEIVAEVANIVDAAGVAPAVGRAVGSEVGVVGVVEQAENTTLGSQVEEQKAQSRIAGAQREKQGFAVGEERIAEVVGNRIVAVADEVCWKLVGGAGTASIAVDMRRREELVEGRAVEHIADAD